ncbi:transposase, partial [Agrobacterium arsenijevicii]
REIRFHGVIENTAESVLRLTKRLVAANTQPILCYEAGTCGYGLHRLLTKLGFDCVVVSPAMIPRRAGNRMKNRKLCEI